MTITKINNHSINVNALPIFIIIILLGVVIIGTIEAKKTIQYESFIDCTTGDLDFNFILNKTNTSMSDFNFTGIDGLRCKMEIKGDLPLTFVYKMIINGALK